MDIWSDTMDLTTEHDRKQRAELKKPLWPIYAALPHCSGPCDQGRRLCMTPEACEHGEGTPLEGVELFRFWASVLAVPAVVMLIGVAVWWLA